LCGFYAGCILITPKPKLGYTLDWRTNTLIPYIFERERQKCWVSGCYYKPADCHESLITRGDVQGWQPSSRRILIFHPANCIGLCKLHHNTELEPSKQEVFNWMIEYYGEEYVIDWLREISLEFKVIPPFVRKVLNFKFSLRKD